MRNPGGRAKFTLIPLVLLGAMATQAQAQSMFDNIWPTGLDVGVSLATVPTYEGSDEYTVQIVPLINPKFGVDSGPKQGIYILPSARIVSERIADDHGDLAGLNDVDASYELGGTLGFRHEWFSSFVTLRYGFGGYNGLVGEAGADVTLEPFEGTTLQFGPRVSFAGEEYMDAYFGVTSNEAVSSGLAAFDPEAGIKGVGLEMSVRQQLTTNLAITGQLNYTALVEDAAESPIVTNGGSIDQVTARVGVVYSF